MNPDDECTLAQITCRLKTGPTAEIALMSAKGGELTTPGYRRMPLSAEQLKCGGTIQFPTFQQPVTVTEAMLIVDSEDVYLIQLDRTDVLAGDLITLNFYGLSSI